MKKTILHIIILLVLCSCEQSSKIETIDIDKSEKLIPLLNQLNISKIEIKKEKLILNDTLINFDTDKTKKIDCWVADTINVMEWIQIHNWKLETITSLKILLKESNNYRIVKENDAYFFSEGGWIDSNYGKAYSKSNLTKGKKIFTIGRLKSIDPIKDKLNWYEYYAD
jgi:hypothetical protein